MKFCTALLSGLLVASQCVVSASDHSVYYEEFKALKKAPSTQAMFTYYLGDNRKASDEQLFNTSLGAIQRDIMTSKSLSLFQMILQYSLFDLDLIIATPETMPMLYSYVDDIFHKAGVPTPTIFVTRQKHCYCSNSIFSQKILIFQGSVVIGQELLCDLSEDQLEAVIAREVGAIKYNHSNKKFLIGIGISTLAMITLNKISFDDLLNKNNVAMIKLIQSFQSSVIVAALMVIVHELFKKQSDRFACERLDKCKGLISCLNRLEQKEELKKVEFMNTYDLLQKNKSRMSILSYILLVSRYCVEKASDFLCRKCDEICSTTPQARIDAVKQYLSQEA